MVYAVWANEERRATSLAFSDGGAKVNNGETNLARDKEGEHDSDEHNSADADEVIRRRVNEESDDVTRQEKLEPEEDAMPEGRADLFELLHLRSLPWLGLRPEGAPHGLGAAPRDQERAEGGQQERHDLNQRQHDAGEGDVNGEQIKHSGVGVALRLSTACSVEGTTVNKELGTGNGTTRALKCSKGLHLRWLRVRREPACLYLLYGLARRHPLRDEIGSGHGRAPAVAGTAVNVDLSALPDDRVNERRTNGELLLAGCGVVFHGKPEIRGDIWGKLLAFFFKIEVGGKPMRRQFGTMHAAAHVRADVQPVGDARVFGSGMGLVHDFFRFRTWCAAATMPTASMPYCARSSSGVPDSPKWSGMATNSWGTGGPCPTSTSATALPRPPCR